ncbi:MAG: hypothetical protein ACR2JS_03370 [Candidatus Nanopelagicales bacterium]
MNEQDLRDCFAMFAMVGLTMRTGIGEDYVVRAGEAYKIADTMLEARKLKEKDDEEDVGIASVAKRSYRRKG